MSINRVLEAEEKRGYHYPPLLLANTWSNQLILSALSAELSSVAQENFVFCRVSLAENAVLPRLKHKHKLFNKIHLLVNQSLHRNKHIGVQIRFHVCSLCELLKLLTLKKNQSTFHMSFYSNTDTTVTQALKQNFRALITANPQRSHPYEYDE